MSYLVLARKYRPQVFEDVVGQESVTRTLANAVTGGRVAHAYLFSGPRGVGKTTAARILAKALNCERGPTAVPCNTCTQCRDIVEGRSFDVLEIDGASNRGINEVRDLRDNTRYAADHGRTKVYIIDEVHMLTTEAFNALLKTLEEPPPHVVFVLATTEPFKVPATILSRCQRFDFARIPSRIIAAHLAKLTGDEGIEAAPDALVLIARRARGGLRDALSLLDQVIPAVSGPLTRQAVEEILGLVGDETVGGMVDCLAQEDIAGLLRRLDDLYVRGIDLGELAETLASRLRDLLLLRIDPELGDLLEATEGEVVELRRQAERFDREVLADLLDRASQIKGTLKYNDHPRLAMELALAEMAQAARQVPLAEIARRLVALEERLGGAPASPPRPGMGPEPATSRATPPTARAPQSPGPERVAEPSPPQATDAEASALWDQCLAGIKEQSMRLWGTLQKAEPVRSDAEGRLVVRAASGYVGDTLREPDTVKLLAEVLEKLGSSIRRVVLEGDAAPEPVAPVEKRGGASEGAQRAAGPARAPSPPAAPPREPTARDERTMGQLMKDEPYLQKALDMFDGEVLP